ncbi:MAG TPA: GNAT family N-acetyltransferase [Solirubrobacterales bacterium]|nr:GNAT family N-acetyltransferase [Solirubrobacterales bacterium]
MKGELHDSLESILPEWEELFRSDPEATPFMSPEWARAWWPSWGSSSRPWTVVVRDSGRLVGLAPFILRRRGPLRILGRPGSHPSQDILATSELRPAVAEEVVREIVKRRREWDLLAISWFPETSSIQPSMKRQGLRLRERRTATYPRLELPSSFDEYLEWLPRKRRKDLRRHLRRLDDGELEVVRVGEPAAIGAAVDRWHALKLSWWEAKEDTEIHPGQRGSRYVGFLRELMPLMVSAGLGEVWELRHSGQVVGVEVSLLDRRNFYSWQGGYDLEVAHLGPGKVAIGEGIRASIAAGRRYYDLMRGADSYKYWYGCRDRESRSLLIGNSRPTSRAALLAIGPYERLRGSSGTDSPDGAGD